MSDSTMWILNLILAIGTLFLVSAAATLEWPRLSQPWRRVVVAVACQQAAIAYGAVEASARAIPAGVRAYLLAASLIALAVTTGLVLWTRGFPRHDSPPGRRVRR